MKQILSIASIAILSLSIGIPSAISQTSRAKQSQAHSAAKTEGQVAAHRPDLDHAQFYEFNSRCVCGEGLCPIIDSGYVSFMDRQGNQTANSTSFEGTTCPTFSEGTMRLSEPGGYSYREVQNASFKPAVPYKFISANPFHEGIASACIDTPSGYCQMVLINHQGRLITPPALGRTRVTSIQPFHEGSALVSDGGFSFGYVDTTGAIILALPPEIIAARSFSDGLAWVQYLTKGQAARWGAIDTKGRQVIPPTYVNEPQPFSEGMAAVQDREERWGFIDKTNTLIIPTQFAEVASVFSDGFAIVMEKLEEEHWEVINKAGKVVNKIDGDEVSCKREDGYCSYHKGVFVRYAAMSAEMETATGLIDKKGHVIIPAWYFRDIGDFQDGTKGLAWAELGGEDKRKTVDGSSISGYINIHGDFVIVSGKSKF